MDTELFHIGDVVAVKAGTKNPYLYRGPLQIGRPRVEALHAFRDGKLQPEVEFWYAPYGGGAKRINSPSEVNWERSGLK